MTHVDEVLTFLGSQRLDWSDLESTGRKAGEILRTIGFDHDCLRVLVDNVAADDRLLRLAEHDRIDKLILYDNLSLGMRIRLHLYPPDHFDGPHNHRWPFTALVLSGCYVHKMFPTDLEMSETARMLALEPLFIRNETRGGSYTVSAKAVHSVIAAPNTVSLIMRGPAENGRLAMTDLETGRLRWKYGRDNESAEELKARAISLDRFTELRGRLQALSLI